MALNHVVILDTETTGLDPKVDACIEVGVILFDCISAVPLLSFATLIRHDSNAAARINRIPVAALAKARTADKAWATVEAIISQGDACLAHNASFDRGFMPANLRDLRPFIDTKSDLAWPLETKPGQSLINLTLEHGLGVSSAHRALADCDMIARLLTRVHELGHPLPAFLARGLRPKATYQALVSFEDKDLAKDAAFSWEPKSKQWIRTMAIDDVAGLGFPVREVA